jgi:hypothetical protein
VFRGADHLRDFAAHGDLKKVRHVYLICYDAEEPSKKCLCRMMRYSNRWSKCSARCECQQSCSTLEHMGKGHEVEIQFPRDAVAALRQ